MKGLFQAKLAEPPVQTDERISEEESAALREASRLISLGRRDEAVSVVQRLARQGYGRAQLYLGWMFASGEAGEVDHDVAWRWCQSSAESGDPVGQYYFGCVVWNGRGKEEGGRWIRRAAAQDYAPALYWEAVLSESGDGMDQDLNRAHTCMKRAAEQGHPFAKMRLAKENLRGHEGVWGVFRALLEFLKLPALAYKLIMDKSLDQNMLEG